MPILIINTPSGASSHILGRIESMSISCCEAISFLRSAATLAAFFLSFALVEEILEGRHEQHNPRSGIVHKSCALLSV